MLVAAFGDIHGNLDALEAVLEAIEDFGADTLVCVGDIIGYGAQPAECIAAIRPLQCTIVAGNHDFAGGGVMALDYFNAYAREALLWTRSNISRFDKEYLSALPLWATKGPLSVVHGSFDHPGEFLYIESLSGADRSMAKMETEIGFLGHSHIPLTYLQDGPELKAVSFEDDVVRPKPGQRAIVNVGSVGQPRDEDPRACWVSYDTEERVIEFHRQQYDVAAAADKIRKASLPEVLALRLEIGR